MSKEKILQYSRWNGRDLFHYCLAHSLAKYKEKDKMFAIEIDDSEVASRMLDVYAMDEGNFYQMLTRRKLEKGISAITETISSLYVSPSEDMVNAIREGGLSNNCVEEIKKLQNAVAELYRFATTDHSTD